MNTVLRPYDLPDKLSKFVNTKSMLTTKFKLKYLSSTVNTGRGDICDLIFDEIYLWTVFHFSDFSAFLENIF